MSRELIRQLKALKHQEVRPRSEWLKNSRALLLSQIKNTVASETKHSYNVDNIWTGLAIFFPKTLVYNVMRPVAVLLIVTMVATSGWVTTVDAAYNALPGDWLYPAKRAAEKTQVAVAAVMGAKTTETKLRTEFAKRRATEAKQIVKGHDPNKNEKVTQVVHDLKQEIKNVNDNLEQVKSDGVSASVIQEVKQDTEQIKNVLQEVKTDLLTAASSSSTDSIAKEVSEAKDMVKDASVKAVAVMVSKHLEGDQSVSVEEVRKEIGATLATMATESDVTKLTIDATKAVVDAAKVEAKEAASAPSGTTSTRELSEKISAVAATTKEAAVKSDEAKVVTDQKITEGQDLLAKGELASAVDKIKEATVAASAVEKINDDALAKVQTVLPVVNVVKEVAPILLTASTTPIQVIVATSTMTTSTSKLQLIVTTTVDKNPAVIISPTIIKK